MHRISEIATLRRAALCALAGLLCALFPNCERRNAARQGELRIALESRPTNLDPRLATDAYSYDVIETLYNGLFRHTDTGEWAPDLAASVEQESKRVWRIRLREGVHFHDGHVLTARDAACTYASIQDPGLGSPLRGSFDPLGRVEVLGLLELRLTLKESYAPFFEMLTTPVLPCEAIKAGRDFNARPLGTGFLRFVERQDPSWILLEPFPEYFGERAELPAKVRFRTVPDATTRVLSLLRGEIDLSVNNVPILYVDYIREKGRLEIQTSPGTSFTYIGFNLRDPILSKQKVRQAIAHAIDRETLVKYRMKGHADIAHTILPDNHWAAARDVVVYDYDPVRAQALLDEAGYPRPADGSARFSLVYKTSQNKERLRMIEVIRQQLEKVGIALDVRSYEWGTFFSQIKQGDFQLFSLSWIGVTDPDFYYGVFHSGETPARGGRNRGFYSNEQVDVLLEKARHTMKRAERADYYGKIQRILSRELPYLPLWYDRNIAIHQPRVAGFELGPLASFRRLAGVHLEEVAR